MGLYFRVEAVPKMKIEKLHPKMDHFQAHKADDRFWKLKTFVFGSQKRSIREGLRAIVAFFGQPLHFCLGGLYRGMHRHATTGTQWHILVNSVRTIVFLPLEADSSTEELANINKPLCRLPMQRTNLTCGGLVCTIIKLMKRSAKWVKGVTKG